MMNADAVGPMDWLGHPLLAMTARAVLTAPFWWSGISKAVRFADAVEEMRGTGLRHPRAAAVGTILVQLVGALLVIAGQGVWLGAGLLAGFTALASLLAHPFWRLPHPHRVHALNACLANLGLIGGLGLVVILAAA